MTDEPEDRDRTPAQGARQVRPPRKQRDSGGAVQGADASTSPPIAKGPRTSRSAPPNHAAAPSPGRARARAEARAAAQAARKSPPQQAEPPAPQPAAPPAAQPSPAPNGVPDPTTDFAAGPIDIPPPGQLRLFNRITKVNFFLMVVLPTLAAIVYFAAFAADRYAVDVKFAIRSPSGVPSNDLIGMVTGGASSGATQSDSYMVVEYLESRQFLDEISSLLDLNAIYSNGKGDALTRLSPTATKEDQVDYLPRVITPHFESSTNILSVEVQAFTPEDARRVAEVVLASASSMVNRVSEQARLDTVRLAQAELARAEEALKEQRNLIAQFRDSEQKIDPNRAVAAQEGVLAGLETELADTRAQMSSLREFLSADAPSVRVLQSRIASIERQIAAERSRLGRGTEPAATGNDLQAAAEASDSLNSAVSRYEELAVDLDFLQRTYLSALGSLESARVEADRQQRYVATFVHPALPEAPRYPRVLLSVGLILIVSTLIWSILTMSIHVIREHLR